MTERRWSPRQGLNNPDFRDETVFIYGLCEPSTGEIRYIGKSSNPEGRWLYHCTAVAVSLRMWHWVRKLRAQGLKPSLQILRVVQPGADAAKFEREVIRECTNAGAALINFHGVPNRARRLSTTSDDPVILELIAMGHPYLAFRRQGYRTRHEAFWARPRPTAHPQPPAGG